MRTLDICNVPRFTSISAFRKLVRNFARHRVCPRAGVPLPVGRGALTGGTVLAHKIQNGEKRFTAARFVLGPGAVGPDPLMDL